MKFKPDVYMKALRLPVIALAIYAVLNLVVNFIAYGSISSLDSLLTGATAALGLVSILGLVGLLIYALYFYAGWVTVKKHGGNTVDAIMVTVLASVINWILNSVIVGLLMYFLSPGYRLLLDPFGAGDPGFLFVITSQIVGLIVGIVVAAIVGAVAGLIAENTGKSSAPAAAPAAEEKKAE